MNAPRFETRRWLAAALILALGGPAAVQSEEVTPRVDFLRGIVVSCPRAGQIWGSPAMADSLREITELGADWVAIHPYAWVSRSGEVRYRPAADLSYLDRAVTLADAAGVELFWKPHLGYWGSFTWRGAIEFGDDQAAWQRFFTGYRDFIVDQARFAAEAGIDLFAVGVEYERTTRHEAQWREIIAAVRQVYPGRLTYAANWDTLDRVPFWDALDLIGVHAYFPLSLEERPLRSALAAGWREPLRRLAALSQMHGDKPVLFAEIGYARSPRAAAEPWLPDLQTEPEVLELRRSLIEVAIAEIESVPWVAGMFWWKWIPGDHRWDRDFSMRDEEARGALRQSWGVRSLTPVTAR